jgi:hypothetical protein
MRESIFNDVCDCFVDNKTGGHGLIDVKLNRFNVKFKRNGLRKMESIANKAITTCKLFLPGGFPDKPLFVCQQFILFAH